ncbi:hypothetical protein [Leptolyngbya ohadii]|nr:hypothetical protein [Leptolyngbya ohadii]
MCQSECDFASFRGIAADVPIAQPDRSDRDLPDGYYCRESHGWET